ncbi:hypothetical protein [Cryobacterium sp. BB736]|uniref:hypothetical protein n=1 Tax=Cryobacterium sp. BB736 TaxID=2746963 RepID=UPI001873E393|nr:hypothetical protein [Cryobacterium sp. BB736]
MGSIWRRTLGIGLGIGLGISLGAGALTIGNAAMLAHAGGASATIDEIAAEFDVQIVWTSDLRNCGAGCWNPATPDVVFVDPNLSESETLYAALHEIGHAAHYRLGLPSNECAADLFAQTMGAAASEAKYCSMHIPEDN